MKQNLPARPLSPNALIRPDIRKEICPGIVFRLSPDQYFFVDSLNRIIWNDKMVMRQIKKLSCPGCRHCGYLHEYLNDESKTASITIRPNIERDALYSLQVVDIQRHPENGLVEDWSLAFVKLPPEEQQLKGHIVI